METVRDLPPRRSLLDARRGQCRVQRGAKESPASGVWQHPQRTESPVLHPTLALDAVNGHSPLQAEPHYGLSDLLCRLALRKVPNAIENLSFVSPQKEMFPPARAVRMVAAIDRAMQHQSRHGEKRCGIQA